MKNGFRSNLRSSFGNKVQGPWFRLMSPCAAPLVLLAFFALGLTSWAASFSPSVLNTATDKTVEVIPLEATVQASPAQIIIKTYAPGTFTIYRKDPSSDSWGTALATGVTLTANATWTDSTVSVGTLYEYQFVNTAGTVYAGTASRSYPTGYILTGINVDQTQPKGRMAVVVASDVPGTLPAEYASYKNDLIADGWTVHEIQVPRAANYNGMGNGAIATVKVNAGGTGSISNGSTATDVVYLVNSSGKRAAAKLAATGGAITSATIYQNGGGSGFSVGDSLTVYGGAGGSGASLTVASVGPSSQVSVASATLTFGTNYTDGQVVTVTGSKSGVTTTGTITTTGKLFRDGSSAIAYVAISSMNGFILGEQMLLSGNTTGTGAGVFCYQGSANVEVVGIGVGYQNGDTATLKGNKSGQTVQVKITTDSSQGYTNLATIKSLSLLPTNPFYPASSFTPGETFSLLSRACPEN